MNPDSLFERRELTRSVHITAPNIQRNIDVSLLAQLRMKYEGICIPEGYVRPRSVLVIEHSLGRINLIKGGVDYTVKFQVDMCLPHPGQVFRALVSTTSKIGLHAEVSPLKVLLPRDLHLGNAEFEAVKEGQEIEFEVVGCRFQQGDESIIVLGTLKSAIQAECPQEVKEAPKTDVPVLDAPTGEAQTEKKVVVPLEQTKPEKRKRGVIPTGKTNAAAV